MIAESIIALAKRTPYRKGHIIGMDGSLYMERYGLFETRYLSARVHYIARPDVDRVLHDHPWNFCTIVIKGGYSEARPVDPNHPVFTNDAPLICGESVCVEQRMHGSIAFRKATDRHKIVDVLPDTWTLFIYGRAVHWWGFYTPAGKIYWADYLREHGRL